MFPLRPLVRAIAALVLVSSTAAAQPGVSPEKIDRALRRALGEGRRTQNVIITLADGCRGGMLDALQRHGDKIKADHALINAIAAEAHSEDLEALAASGCVRAVSSDADVFATGRARRKVRSASVVPSTRSTANVLRETLGLPAVATNETLTGSSGIGVAIIDSGIAPSGDFAGRISGFYDFTRGGMATPPYDDYGHGTHIAGLIASSGRLSNYQYQGIAPDVRIVALKVLDRTGRGRTSDVIGALEFVTMNRARLNVQIVNISLGHPIYAPAKDDPLVQAVERATASGLIVVVSAGNFGLERQNGDTGYAGITSPGNAPSAITVGAARNEATVVRSDDAVALYSSRGPSWLDAHGKPDVVAPGHQLLSDTSLTSYLYKNLPARRVRSDSGQPLLELSGTSMAAGVTSGVVALVLQQHNQNGFHRQRPLTANLVKAMLQFSAIPVAGADHLTQGAGQINAAGATELARNIDTSARPGVWWLAGGVTPSTAIGGEIASWSGQVIWNDTVLTGDLLYYNAASWSSAAGWGDDNIIWGSYALVADDNIIWGTTATWASNLVWTDRIIGLDDGDNIIWGSDEDNIIWGSLDVDNIIWGSWNGGALVWSSWDGDNIIWGSDEDIVIRASSTPRAARIIH